MIQVLGIALVCVLILFTLQVFSTRYTESNLLKGFWKGSPSFVKQAELDLFMIYIGDSGIFSSIRPG